MAEIGRIDKIFSEFVKYWQNLKILAKFDPNVMYFGRILLFCKKDNLSIQDYKVTRRTAKKFPPGLRFLTTIIDTIKADPFVNHL